MYISRDIESQIHVIDYTNYNNYGYDIESQEYIIYLSTFDKLYNRLINIL